MTVREEPEFEENLKKLRSLLDLQEEPRTDINQRYITTESIIKRLDILKETGQLEDNRVLTIGDADLTGLAIALFGNPKEVVVADIDDRLSEIYFEASMEYDLPVRYLYHDMRIKIIAILRKQYSMVLMEPPRTTKAMEVFLSRGMEILEPGDNNYIFIHLPKGHLQEDMKKFIQHYDIKIKQIHEGINEYFDGSPPSDMIQLELPNDVEPEFKNHFIRPFYEQEVAQDLHNYRCVCEASYQVGVSGDFTTVEELEASGCSKCDYQGVFAFKSEIQLK